jgi:hypothetical protein
VIGLSELIKNVLNTPSWVPDDRYPTVPNPLTVDSKSFVVMPPPFTDEIYPSVPNPSVVETKDSLRNVVKEVNNVVSSASIPAVVEIRFPLDIYSTLKILLTVDTNAVLRNGVETKLLKLTDER